MTQPAAHRPDEDMDKKKQKKMHSEPTKQNYFSDLQSFGHPGTESSRKTGKKYRRCGASFLQNASVV